ncbi:MAG: entericidin A/B family lipoprotein [Desulfosoma sp.]
MWKDKTWKTLILGGLIVFLFGGLSACNTVKGIGKDIRSLGGAIERSAGGGK